MIRRFVCHSGRREITLTTALAACALFSGNAPAATLTATTSQQFISALNDAVLGDTIILTAGTTYTGSFTLPNKTAGSGYITIQSSALASLPPSGTRVNLSHAAHMPKIQAPGGAQSAITAAISSHHYKLIGLEIIGPADDSHLYNLISLGDSGTAQDTLAEVPHDFVINRCVIRPNSNTAALIRGIGLNSASTEISDCYISDFKDPDNDSQAIAGWNGPGPYTITNNYLEGAGENFMLGGADPSIPDLVPSDIVFTKNHCFKPLTWNHWHPSYAGTKWSVKNIFELKNARRVTIEGNIFEHNWVGSQDGRSILFTPRNQSGTAPWCTLEDVTFTKNIFRNGSGGFNIQSRDDENGVSDNIKRLKIENNLIYGLGGKEFGSGGILFNIMGKTPASDRITINHNTSFHTSNVATLSGAPSTNFVFTNNLQAHNAYGVIGDGVGVGNPALNTFTTEGRVFTKNVLMTADKSIPGAYSEYPGNFFPTSWSGVLVNQASPGADFAGWKVVTGSVYDNAGVNADGTPDGKDIGCNIDEIVAATAGCISGVWGTPPTTGPRARQ